MAVATSTTMATRHPTQTRSALLRARVSEVELERWRLAEVAEGLTLSDFVRMAARLRLERLVDRGARIDPTGPFEPDERSRILGWFERKLFGVRPGPGSSRTRRLAHRPYYVFVHMLFWSGMRPSEVAGLHWEDVDLAAARIYVRRSEASLRGRRSEDEAGRADGADLPRDGALTR